MNLDRYPRVGFFTEGFEETDTQLDAFARRHGLPFLTVRCAAANGFQRVGESCHLTLDRSRAAIHLDGNIDFDPLLLRHHARVKDALKDFRPDVIHVTSPGDIGLLGVHCARTLQIPLVVSWHANVHEHAARRLRRVMADLPQPIGSLCESLTEEALLYGLYRFHGLAQLLLAPNENIVQLLHRMTGRTTQLMRPGIDTSLFAPLKRVYADGVLRIGYAGRLSPEKNVRLLAQLERSLRQKVTRPFRFLIVGDGSERPWLQDNLTNAEFPGDLDGEALAREMARMDIFAFPSETDAFGDAVLKAMASGVPAVVMSKGGPRFIVEDGISGIVSSSPDDFVRNVHLLLTRPEMRRRMAIAARARASQSSWENACETLYRAYRLAVRSFPVTRNHLPMMPPSPIGLRHAI